MKNYDHIEKSSFVTTYFDENNKYHRLDGPAREYTDGSTIYYEHGLLHRVGGPACLDTAFKPHPNKAWYRYDKKHRLNAPAIFHGGQTTSCSYYEFGNWIR